MKLQCCTVFPNSMVRRRGLTHRTMTKLSSHRNDVFDVYVQDHSVESIVVYDDDIFFVCTKHMCYQCVVENDKSIDCYLQQFGFDHDDNEYVSLDDDESLLPLLSKSCDDMLSKSCDDTVDYDCENEVSNDLPSLIDDTIVEDNDDDVILNLDLPLPFVNSDELYWEDPFSTLGEF